MVSSRRAAGCYLLGVGTYDSPPYSGARSFWVTPFVEASASPSEKQLSSWVGACPGDEESAGVNYSHRSPQGNRQMRRLLNQSANAAVKAKGSISTVENLTPHLQHLYCR